MQVKKYSYILIVLSLSACAYAPEKGTIKLPKTVAKVGDAGIARDQVRQESAARLAKWRMQQYDIFKETIDHLIEQKLIQEAARKKNKTPEEWLKERIDNKIQSASDAEIASLYEQHKERMNGQTLEQAKPMLSGFLQKQQRQTLYEGLIKELKSQTPVTILLEPPRVRVTENNRPSRGPKSAPVLIIEFSDYQCPFCGRAEETLDKIHKFYVDLVRIVFRNYPLPFHPHAQKAAEAAGCAGLQGRFQEMHDMLFQNTEALAIENLKDYGRKLGLDMDLFEKCLDSGSRAAEIAQDVQDGKAVGVSGTPAFFINGRFVSGALPFESFVEIIDEELTRAHIKIPPKPLDMSAQQ